ncbi:hypothetical protein WKY82_03185 [Gordonia malaquae]|uniref:hypothetical protein n=1 Tax=Gordonia malaquae TaxID=410332 RepID=UPI0030C79B90
MTGEVWNDASTTYSDWRGTAQLDSRMSADLHELVGLDQESWVILGLEIGGGERDGFDHLAVLAAPAGTDFTGPRLEATKFYVTHIKPVDALANLMYSFDLRLRAKGFDGFEIKVADSASLPGDPQGE